MPFELVPIVADPTPANLWPFGTGIFGLLPVTTDDIGPEAVGWTQIGWVPTDEDAPYIIGRNPAPSEEFVALDSYVSFSVLDDDSGINETSIWIRIADGYAWLSGSVQPGFSVVETAVANGFCYSIHRLLNFPPLTSILVEVYVEDQAFVPNALLALWNFRTTRGPHAPFLENRNPGSEFVGLAPEQSWSFDLLDAYGDTLASSIRIYVGKTQVYSGSTQSWTAPYDGYFGKILVDGYDGYHIRIDHPISAPSARIDIRVLASDAQGGDLDETYGFWIAPSALQPSLGPYEITVELPFSGAMDPASVFDASLFHLSGGAYVKFVEILTPDRVRLWVERLWSVETISLTVSRLVADTRGAHPIFDTVFDISKFNSTAFFSNATGLLRTWHVDHLVQSDLRRAYFAGEKGVDIFDTRFGIQNAFRWAQVLDEYGIMAMCVLNSADSYSFDTITSPHLENLNPWAGQGGVSTNANISFSVLHSLISVEAISLVIYVNTILVFAGSAGGWAHSWGGQIAARPEGLDVELFSPAPFAAGSTVFVRVMASDLLGNQLDMTYSFTVAP